LLTSGIHRRTGRAGHGLNKVSLGPTMPYPSKPCRRTTPETTLQSFQEWPARRAGGLRLFSTPLDTPRRTPMVGFSLSANVQTVDGLGGDPQSQERISWGSRGSSKVSLGPAIPYHSIPCGQPTPSWPNGRLGVGHLQEECTILLQGPPEPPLKYGHARSTMKPG
jgi:hypothetical protein